MRFLFSLWLLCRVGSAALAISPEALDQSLEKHIRYHQEGENTIGHIYIGGHSEQISQGTFIYVKNALSYFQKEVKPIFVILELDTPGGQVFPAQKISDLLKELDTLYDIPVIAYINNWAISAGAMLAYSCRYIATVKDASMGAAQPVTQSGETTSEKVNSAIRADFAGRAAFFDRNPLIAEAMVDPDLVLVIREGQILELASNEAIKESDTVITRKGKLLTLSSQQMIEWGVADLRLLPQKLEPITEAEKAKGEWRLDQTFLTSYPFFAKIPNAVIKSYKMDWKTRFFSFLSHPIVTSILFLGLILGVYLEMSTPGFGLAGGIALFCLALIILSSFAIQAAGWFEFILLGAGIALILLEVFVIPGFGIIGILGIILALVGLLGLLLPGLSDVHFDFDSQTLNAAGEYLLQRLAYLSGALIIGTIAIAILAKYFAPRFALFSPLVLRGEQEASKGFVAGLRKEELPPIGAVGITLSPLRTAGKVEIEGEIFDVVSSGQFIEKGAKVKVVQIEGSKMVVEEMP